MKNRFPNFITVDFYELGNGLDVVDQLNDVNTSVNNITLKKSKKLLSIIDIVGRKTSVKITL